MDSTGDFKENLNASLNASDADILRRELRDFNMSIDGKSMSWAVNASDAVGEVGSDVPASPKPVLTQRQSASTPLRSPQAIKEKLEQAEKRRQAQLEARTASAASEVAAVRKAAETRMEQERQLKEKAEMEHKKKMQVFKEQTERRDTERIEAVNKQAEHEDKVRQSYKESLVTALAKWENEPVVPLTDAALDAIAEEDLDARYTAAEEQLKVVRHILEFGPTETSKTEGKDKDTLQEQCTVAAKKRGIVA